MYKVHVCMCVCESHTCPVSCVVEIDSEGAWLMLGLPAGRRAVLVVRVSVVVVCIFASQD